MDRQRSSWVRLLGFGLTMILRPGSVRANFNRFADYSKQEAGQLAPIQVASLRLRLAGLVMLAVATLFFYITFVAFSRQLIESITLARATPIPPTNNGIHGLRVHWTQLPP